MAGVAAPAGAIVAAAISLKRKKILRTFRDLGALSPESAKSSQDIRLRRSLLFRRMVRTGVLVDCGNDHYYLDEDAAERGHQRRLRRVKWILAAVTVAVIAMLVLERM